MKDQAKRRKYRSRRQRVSLNLFLFCCLVIMHAKQ